ncbi:MAG: CHAT domain-containing protein [Deltaproteobacteria bacterium]|nr:CHAT domain-containing protein [Deltaproteobacteria bacterium]
MLPSERWCRYALVACTVLGLLALARAAGASLTIDEAEGGDRQVLELMLAGDYRKALGAAQGVLAARQAGAGPEDPAVAAALIQLAQVREAAGDYAGMAQPAARAEAILSKRGDRPAGVARALLLQAQVRLWRGDLVEAGALARRAAALGRDAPAVAAEAGRRLGEIQLAAGDFETAENTCLEAGAKVGEQDIERARADLCTADAYVRKGFARLAPKTLQQASVTLAGALGDEHPESARALVRLADYYARTGEARRGERLFARAIELLERALGPQSRFVAEAGARLADLHHLAGEDAQAGPLYEKAYAAARQGLGDGDPDVAARGLNLAHFEACARGNFARAAELGAEAAAIEERALGSAHPEVGKALGELAQWQLASGDGGAAVRTLVRANDIIDRDLGRLLGLGSEAQKRVNSDYARWLTNLTVSLHLVAAPDDLEAARLALRTVLRRKGRVLDAMAGDLLEIRSELTPADLKLLRELGEARAAVAATEIGRVRRGSDGREGGTNGIDAHFVVGLFSRKLSDLEGQLGARSRALAGKLQPVEVGQVAQALPEGHALVEIVHFRPAKVRARRGEERHGAARYGAYVLHPDGTLDWADLGPAAPIDALVGRFRQLIVARSPETRQLARELDAALLRPLRPLLRGARSLFVSLDGQLHLLPLAALVDENGALQLETYAITYVTSGRDLLRFGRPAPAGGPPVIVAAPDFDAGAQGGAVPAAGAGSEGEGGGRGAMVDLTRMRFPPLPGTAEEAAALSSLVEGASVLTGAQASETALLAARGPRVLHVATHGFFLADRQGGLAGSRGLVLEETDAGAPQPARKLVELGEPLLRSGLALRGANAVWGYLGGGDDGLLTALEAASLDLYGTRLVVLSACETGIGEVGNGEGVYGLRRALAIAGAQTQVMSLWKVDDEATRDLMIAYYRGLAQGGGRAEALRQAQLAFLAERARAHPYFWAAFIASGDPRSLKGNPVVPRLTREPPHYEPPPVRLPPGTGGCGCRTGGRAPAPACWPLVAVLLAAGAARRAGCKLASRARRRYAAGRGAPS